MQKYPTSGDTSRSSRSGGGGGDGNVVPFTLHTIDLCLAAAPYPPPSRRPSLPGRASPLVAGRGIQGQVLPAALGNPAPLRTPHEGTRAEVLQARRSERGE